MGHSTGQGRADIINKSLALYSSLCGRPATRGVQVTREEAVIARECVRGSRNAHNMPGTYIADSYYQFS